jgi:hypothetical protein
MGFLDKVKAGAQEATQKVKEGAADVQTKRDIGQTYDELGKKTYQLATSGAVSHPEIDTLVKKIDDLKAKLEEDEGADGAAAPDEAPAVPS